MECIELIFFDDTRNAPECVFAHSLRNLIPLTVWEILPAVFLCGTVVRRNSSFTASQNYQHQIEWQSHGPVLSTNGLNLSWPTKMVAILKCFFLRALYFKIIRSVYNFNDRSTTERVLV